LQALPALKEMVDCRMEERSVDRVKAPPRP